MNSALVILRRAAFIAAFALSLTTQSRAWLAGVGLGEVMGSVFIALALAQPGNLQPRVKLALAIFVAGFLVGATVNQFTGISHQFVLRDLFALCFAMVFATCAVTYLRNEAQAVVTLGVALTLAVFVQCIPLLLLLGGIESNAWLTDSEEAGIPFLSRYIGFSDNPNQLGVLLCAYPFAAIAAVAEAQGRLRRATLVVGLLAGLLLAVLARSNTVFAAYILGATLWAVMRLNRWGGSSARGTDLWRVSLTLLLCIVAVGGFAFFAGESIDKTGDADANGRFQRWQNAIEGIVESGLLGVGPGGQSGEKVPFDGEEAHNFLLDVALQGGALSLVAYVALVFGAGLRIFRLRSLSGACLLAAVLTQQFAHYTARQPIAWVYVLFPYGLVGAGRRAPRTNLAPMVVPTGGKTPPQWPTPATPSL